MIVTRRRRTRPQLGRYLLPLAALAALAIALAWPPSHDAIANGPLHPAWVVGANLVNAVSGPFRFAAQQQQITERNRQIRDLNGRLEQQRAATAADEAKVAQLQQQLRSMHSQQLRPGPIPAVKPSAAAAAAAAAPGAALLGGTADASVSDADRKLAAAWSAMDPEKAAAVVQRLPDDQVTRIFGLMDAQATGAILDALPAAVAARLSRSGPQVGSASNR